MLYITDLGLGNVAGVQPVHEFQQKIWHTLCFIVLAIWASKKVTLHEFIVWNVMSSTDKTLLRGFSYIYIKNCCHWLSLCNLLKAICITCMFYWIKNACFVFLHLCLYKCGHVDKFLKSYERNICRRASLCKVSLFPIILNQFCYYN
jgi:hypothetical protein